MSDVFVSYKAEDRARVRPLVQALQEDGYSVWWDAQIGGGSAWRQAIETELDSAKCVVVVWSKRSAGIEGTFVHDEATRAQQRRVYVPILIDKVRVPLGFGETQVLPLTSWRGDRSDPRYSAVRSAVDRIARGGGTAPPDRAGPLPLSRRKAIAAGSAALLVAAGTGAWLLLRPSAVAGSDSIAVLPFDNFSGDPSQAYFSDGMSEELRSALARIPHLRVVARTSSEAVRSEDAKSAAQKLGVANILAGSVRRSPTLIRVSAQLIDGRTGLERWSEQFDQPVGDTLAIQSSIANRVAEALRLQLAGSVRTILNLGGTNIIAAQDLFLKAKLNSKPDSPEGLRASLVNVDAAIELDPRYALAYALKSELLAYFSAQNARSPSEVRTLLNDAVANAAKAIAIAPGLAQGHSALGFAYNFQLRFRDALREVQTAVRLPGADADVYGRYAMLLEENGHSDGALRAAANAVTLDPLNPGAYQQQALVLFMGRKFAPAVAAARRALELDPTRIFVRGILANSLLMMGRNDDAGSEYAKMPADNWQAIAGRAIIAARSHDLATCNRLLQELRAAWGDSAIFQFAEIHAQLGDANRAIAYLRKPVAQRDPGFIFILRDPFLDPVRSDPRFKEIIRSLDFPA
jgi:serine/threonine-protein kinase